MRMSVSSRLAAPGVIPSFFRSTVSIRVPALQLDFQKGAFRWPDPLVLASCRVECPIGSSKFSAQFLAVFLAAARRSDADRVQGGRRKWNGLGTPRQIDVWKVILGNHGLV